MNFLETIGRKAAQLHPRLCGCFGFVGTSEVLLGVEVFYCFWLGSFLKGLMVVYMVFFPGFVEFSGGFDSMVLYDIIVSRIC